MKMCSSPVLSINLTVDTGLLSDIAGIKKSVICICAPVSCTINDEPLESAIYISGTAWEWHNETLASKAMSRTRHDLNDRKRYY